MTTLTELDRSNIPELESTEKYAVLVYYKTGDAIVEELSSFLSSTSDSVLLNANWFKCCVHPEENVNYVGASIAAVVGIDIENLKENVFAVMLEEKGKKFGTTIKSPLDNESLKTWLQSVQDGTATPSIKSEERLPNDEFPDKKGLTKLVASAFDEIVMNPAKDVFVDIYADWCGPCQMIAPLIAKVAKVLADESNIVISKMNSDLNDYSEKLFPEGTIPNMKLFKAGADLKEHPIKFNGERSAVGILKWLHDNCVNKFDLDKYLPICQKYDDFFPTRLEAECSVQEARDDLEFKSKCDEGNVSAVEKIVSELESSIEEEDVDKVTKLMESLRVSSDREAIRVVADKARLGDVIKIHSQEEFETNLKSDKLVVVDFTAQWCGPCQFIAPLFAAMSTTYPEACFLKVDVDESEVASKCGIQCMPTFQLYKNGVKIEEVQGADPETLEALIQKHK